MLIYAYKLPRGLDSRACDLEAKDTACDCSVPASFVYMVLRGNRAVCDVFCKGAVYDCANTNWSARERTNVGGDVSLVF